MSEKLKQQLETEKGHSAFLERLLEALYGEGWNKLTLHEAKTWHKRHLINHSSRAPGACANCRRFSEIKSGTCIIEECVHYPPQP